MDGDPFTSGGLSPPPLGESNESAAQPPHQADGMDDFVMPPLPPLPNAATAAAAATPSPPVQQDQSYSANQNHDDFGLNTQQQQEQLQQQQQQNHDEYGMNSHQQPAGLPAQYYPPVNDMTANASTTAVAPKASGAGPAYSTTAAAGFQQQQIQEEKITSINGIGLWNSWTRNFGSPLLAMWDLMDNAIDASCPVSGKVHVEPDSFSGHRIQSSGIRIQNTCKEPVAPLNDILKAYQSSKAKADESQVSSMYNAHHNPDHHDDAQSMIGENGVGVKQGSATLSDLSFVVTRNRNVLALGVLAKDLQKKSGIYLPSWTWTSRAVTDYSTQIMAMSDGSVAEAFLEKLKEELFVFTNCREDIPLAQVFALYGGWKVEVALRDYPTMVPPPEFLHRGIERVADHFWRMSDRESYGRWGNHDHVFCLVLANLKHSGEQKREEFTVNKRNFSTIAAVKSENREATGSNGAHVLSFLNQMKAELPRMYLHINHSFDLEVNRVPVRFSYWQRRLVELTQIDVLIDTQYPTNAQNILADFSDDYVIQKQEYKLRVYLGFDPLRGDEHSGSAAQLVWYSRKAGRMIKLLKDGRGELGLNNSGTDFAQGLTIVVDDAAGRLPLNPTKTDFAFGERATGETHQENLKMWISAATTAYWKFHCKTSHTRKKILSERVACLREVALEHVNNEDSNAPINVKSIGECQFKVVPSLQFAFRYNKVIPKTNSFQPIAGRDTIMELPPPPPLPPSDPPSGHFGGPLGPPVPDGQISSYSASPVRKRKRESNASLPDHRFMLNGSTSPSLAQVLDLTLSDSEGDNGGGGDQRKIPAQRTGGDVDDDGDGDYVAGQEASARRTGARMRKLQYDLNHAKSELERVKKHNQQLEHRVRGSDAVINRYREEKNKIWQQAQQFHQRKEHYKKERDQFKQERDAIFNEKDVLVQQFQRQVETLRQERDYFKSRAERLQEDKNELQKLNNFLKDSNIEEAADL